MFLTKKKISRRTVLRGLGSMVALPFLEAMVPAQTPLGDTAAKPKSRFAAIEVVHGCAGSTPHGNDIALWKPFKEGADFEFGRIIEPLEPFSDYVTLVSNTDCGGADSTVPEEVGADHFRNAAVFLTAAHPKQTVGADVYCGTSIDQVYAQKHGPGHTAAVDPIVHRGNGRLRLLRLQVQLRLHGHHQLVVADDTAPDGLQSPRRL